MRIVDADALKEEVLEIQGEHFISDDKSVLFTHKEVLALIDGVIDNVIVIIDNAPTIQGIKIIGYEDMKGEL